MRQAAEVLGLLILLELPLWFAGVSWALLTLLILLRNFLQVYPDGPPELTLIPVAYSWRAWLLMLRLGQIPVRFSIKSRFISEIVSAVPPSNSYCTRPPFVRIIPVARG